MAWLAASNRSISVKVASYLSHRGTIVRDLSKRRPFSTMESLWDRFKCYPHSEFTFVCSSLYLYNIASSIRLVKINSDMYRDFQQIYIVIYSSYALYPWIYLLLLYYGIIGNFAKLFACSIKRPSSHDRKHCQQKPPCTDQRINSCFFVQVFK